MNKDQVCTNLNETVMNDSHLNSNCSVIDQSSRVDESSKRVHESIDVGEKNKSTPKRQKLSNLSQNSIYKVLQHGQKAKDGPSVFDGWSNMSITKLVNGVLTESGVDTRANEDGRNPLLKRQKKIKDGKSINRNESNEIRKCLRLIGFCIKSEADYKMFTKQVTIPRPGTAQRNEYIHKCKVVSNQIAQDVCVQLKAHCTRKKALNNYNSMSILRQYIKKPKTYPWVELFDPVDPNDKESKPILSWKLVNDKKRN